MLLTKQPIFASILLAADNPSLSLAEQLVFGDTFLTTSIEQHVINNKETSETIETYTTRVNKHSSYEQRIIELYTYICWQW